VGGADALCVLVGTGGGIGGVVFGRFGGGVRHHKSSIPRGSPIPNESRHTLRAIAHPCEQVVFCRKGRIFLPARAKNHLLAALR